MYFGSEDIRYLSIGGQILGGGGGGRKERGLKTAAEAMEMGRVELVGLDSLSASDIVVTVSGVGAPSKKEAMYTSDHYLRALELIEQQLGKPIAGFIPSEMGASSAFGPFIAAAVKGVPVIDAACDGRAHPLGTMGSLGLDRDPCYQTLQAACGGKTDTGTYTEMVVRGTVASTSRAVRMAAELSGGLAAVTRNPVSAGYLKENAAIGCYSQAMRIGRAVSAASSPMEKARAAAKALSGKVLFSGEVGAYQLISEGGLDHGSCTINTDSGVYVLFFYNEFMAVEQNGQRLYTFPDLMTAFDLDTGEILSTADLHQGSRIVLLTAPRSSLILPSGLRIPEHYRTVEDVLGIPMLPYLRDLF